MKQIFRKFFAWYENNLTLNIAIVAFLFSWQLVHLFWLTTDVVFLRLFGASFFNPSRVLEILIIIADYAEVPAILSASLFYASFSRRGEEKLKSTLMLLFVNSQWFHIFWITDEFVINQFIGIATVLPVWLVWIAIIIDYLELPVIYDTLKRTFKKNPSLLIK